MIDINNRKIVPVVRLSWLAPALANYSSREISDQAFPAFNYLHTHDNAAYNAHVSGEAWERGYTLTTRGKPGAIVDRERGSPGPHAERGRVSAEPLDSPPLATGLYYSSIPILSLFLFTPSLYVAILNLKDFSFTC